MESRCARDAGGAADVCEVPLVAVTPAACHRRPAISFPSSPAEAIPAVNGATVRQPSP